MIRRLLLAWVLTVATVAVASGQFFNPATFFPQPAGNASTTWDPLACPFTLSNGNLTATTGAGTTTCKTTTSKTTGKWYLRATGTTGSISDFAARHGYADTAAATNTNMGGVEAHSVACLWAFGATPQQFFNGVSDSVNCSTTTPTANTPFTFEMALDIPNGRNWMRIVGDAFWNNNASADPATNVGGNLLHITCPCFVASSHDAGSAQAIYTLVLNIGTLPTGFSYWQ